MGLFGNRDWNYLGFNKKTKSYYDEKGFVSFSKAMPLWIKEKLFQKNLLFNKLKAHDKKYTSDDLSKHI